jgi:hypothetical protein
MLDSFNIKITKLIKLPQVVIDNYPEEFGNITDLVTLIHFDFVASKNEMTATKSSEIHVPFDKNAEYIPFSELNEQVVMDWLNSKLTEETIQSVKEELEQELDSRQENNSVETLPWE